MLHPQFKPDGHKKQSSVYDELRIFFYQIPFFCFKFYIIYIYNQNKTLKKKSMLHSGITIPIAASSLLDRKF